MLACTDPSPLPSAAAAVPADDVCVVWRPVSVASDGPTGRSFHTLTRLVAVQPSNKETNPDGDSFLLLLGGRGPSELATDAAWVYSCRHGAWAPLAFTSVVTAADAADHPSLFPMASFAPRAYHTAVAAPAAAASVSSFVGTHCWVLGGKTSLDDDPADISADLLRIHLVQRVAPASVREDGDSRQRFGVEAVIYKVLDDVTSIGPRAYHGCVPATTPTAPHPPRLVAFGGYSGARLLDVVSTFDTGTMTWTNTFATAAEREKDQLTTPNTRSHLSPAPTHASVRRSRPRPLAPPVSATGDGSMEPEPADPAASVTATPPRGSPLGPAEPESPTREGRGGSWSRATSLESCARALSAPAEITEAGSAAAPVALASPNGPMASPSTACAMCGARAACVHASARLSQLVEDGRLLSAATMATRHTRPSLPPRDAAVLCATPSRDARRSATTEAEAATATTIFVLNGEVCTEFFNSALSVDVRADGRATWRADDPGDAAVDDAIATTSRTAGPAPRAYQCAWPVGGRCVAAFAGYSPAGFHDEVCVFDTVARRWRREARQLAASENHACPPPRASAAAAPVVDSVAGAAVGGSTGDNHHVGAAFVFGGDDGATYFDDLWRCDVYDAPAGASAARLTLRSLCEAFLAPRLH